MTYQQHEYTNCLSFRLYETEDGSLIWVLQTNHETDVVIYGAERLPEGTFAVDVNTLYGCIQQGNWDAITDNGWGWQLDIAPDPREATREIAIATLEGRAHCLADGKGLPRRKMDSAGQNYTYKDKES